MSKFDIIKKHIDAFDYEELLACHAPQDEFDSYSRTLAESVTEQDSAEEIAAKIAGIMDPAFGNPVNPAKFAETARNIREELYGRKAVGPMGRMGMPNPVAGMPEERAKQIAAELGEGKNMGSWQTMSGEQFMAWWRSSNGGPEEKDNTGSVQIEGATVQYRLATEKDLDGIMVMVGHIIARPGTAWDEEYPLRENFASTLANDGLYVALEGDRVVGTVGIDPAEDIFADLPCWTPARKPAEGTRFGIDPEYQGKHLAIPFMTWCVNDAHRRLGYDWFRFTAAKENRRANDVYTYFGFDRVGDTNWIDIDWWCYEAALPMRVDRATGKRMKPEQGKII